MKHLKSYNESIFDIFKSKNNIRSICEKYRIKNYTINKDGSVDVGGDVDIYNKDLTKLPIKFKKVTGSFRCCDNYNLTTLKGCPEYVGGVFECENNHLTSLEGGPKSIGGNFYCINNKLASLEGCPGSVGGHFVCSDNKIITFEHLPLSIGGYFSCSDNPINEIWKLFQDYSKIEFLNYCDALREPDADSEEPIVILDRLNFFLEEIGKKPVKRVEGYKCI